jgi:hypothetical protein
LKEKRASVNDLKLLSQMLNINLIHLKNEKEIEKIIKQGNPTVTLNQEDSIWSTHITISRRTASPYVKFFKDSVLNKDEIVSVLMSYRSQTIGLFLSHHQHKAQEIIDHCKKECVTVEMVINEIKNYLDNPANKFSPNSEFKNAADYILSRYRYYNGAYKEASTSLDSPRR